MKLYELNEQIERFELEIDEETGEIANLDELNALEMERGEKIENIGLLIKNLTAESDAIKEEAKKLTARAKVTENKAERLKAYLTDMLHGEKLNTPRLSISYRTSKAVEITDITKLPEEFYAIEKKPDKMAIKKAMITDGDLIPGAKIEERVSTIIK